MSNYHNISELIDNIDREVVLSLVTEGCKILNSTVARLYYIYKDSWIFYDTGLIVLVKNFNEKRYYIEFYDIDNCTKMFAEKIGKSFQYMAYNSNLHLFMSGPSCVLLNMADSNEAGKFSESMNKLIKSKDERESLEKYLTSSHELKMPVTDSDSRKQAHSEAAPKKPGVPEYNQYKVGMIKRRFRHSKSDVGLPYNFIHVDHLGQNGYFLGEIEHDELKNYLADINMEFLIDDKEMDRTSSDNPMSSDTNFFQIQNTKTPNKFLKSKISKSDIGNPERFVHVQHFGMNDSENFDLREEYPNIFPNDQTDSNTQTTNVQKEKPLERKATKLKISKSDISIPTNFRHVEHFGDKNILFDEEEDTNSSGLK